MGTRRSGFFPLFFFFLRISFIRVTYTVDRRRWENFRIQNFEIMPEMYVKASPPFVPTKTIRKLSGRTGPL